MLPSVRAGQELTFKPQDVSSSVTVQAHNAKASFFAVLVSEVILRIFVKLRALSYKPAPAAQPRLAELVSRGKIEGKWHVKITDYELSPALRADAKLKLDSWQIWRIVPAHIKDPREVRRTIVYYPGGAYINPPGEGQVASTCVLANMLDAQVIFIPYPLAPGSTAALEYPRLVRIYEQIYLEARQAGHQVIVAGDSAGGGMAAAILRAVETLGPHICPSLQQEDATDKLMPDQLLLNAPWLDGTFEMHRALLPTIRKHDFWLTAEQLGPAAEIWAGAETPSTWGGYDAKVHKGASDRMLAEARAAVPPEASELLPAKGEHGHPLVSPGLDDAHYALLKRHGIKVVVAVGTQDILYAHSLAYIERLEREAVPTHAIIGQGGVHVYPVLAYIGVKDSRTALQWMADAVIRFESGGKP